jgi:hypothetical protein
MKTKLILLLAFAVLSAASSFAQDAMPTKEETVNYLNKKSQEIVDHYHTYIDGIDWGRVQYSKISFSLKGDKVELKYEGKGSRIPNDCTLPLRSEIVGSYQFNPAHLSRIVTIKAQKPNEPIQMLRLYFSAKTVRSSGYAAGSDGCGGSSYSNQDRLVTSRDALEFPFFANDPTNLSKIQKALLHLRDLAKAEDDPFGN